MLTKLKVDGKKGHTTNAIAELYCLTMMKDAL